MKNIINTKPTTNIHGRTLYNALFVEDKDVTGKILLDIGCGYGWMELNLINRGAKHITAVEMSEADLITARENISDLKVTFTEGNAIKLPFDDASFDTVVSWEVIEHIPKYTEIHMFSEVSRVLRPGGCFYISTPYNTLLSNIFDPAWWLMGHRHYTKKQLLAYASDNDFDLCKIVINGGWWEIIGINNLYIAKWLFRRQPFMENFINQKQDEEYSKGGGFTNIFASFVKKD